MFYLSSSFLFCPISCYRSTGDIGLHAYLYVLANVICFCIKESYAFEGFVHDSFKTQHIMKDFTSVRIF